MPSVTCPECGGSGLSTDNADYPCGECGGDGIVNTRRATRDDEE